MALAAIVRFPVNVTGPVERNQGWCVVRAAMTAAMRRDSCCGSFSFGMTYQSACLDKWRCTAGASDSAAPDRDVVGEDVPNKVIVEAPSSIRSTTQASKLRSGDPVKVTASVVSNSTVLAALGPEIPPIRSESTTGVGAIAGGGDTGTGADLDGVRCSSRSTFKALKVAIDAR